MCSDIKSNLYHVEIVRLPFLIYKLFVDEVSRQLSHISLNIYLYSLPTALSLHTNFQYNLSFYHRNFPWYLISTVSSGHFQSDHTTPVSFITYSIICMCITLFQQMHPLDTVFLKLEKLLIIHFKSILTGKFKHPTSFFQNF